MVSISNLFQTAFIILICASLFSCGTSENKSDNLDLTVNFLEIKDINNFNIRENGIQVIFEDKISNDRYICFVSDSNYIKTYKHISPSGDSLEVFFWNRDVINDNYAVDIIKIEPPTSKWPTSEPIEFSFPKILFGKKTLFLTKYDSIGNSIQIDSAKIFNGNAILKIPFDEVMNSGFSIVHSHESKYSKYQNQSEHVFGR
jgi:hypothetical protein